MDTDLERLIETWRGPLTALVAGWGADWSEAAELAQDTLVEAWLGRARLRGALSDRAVAGPWLLGIARNLRRSRRRAWRARRLQVDPAQLDLEVVAEGPAGGCDERLEALRAAMARLPEKHRAVLYLHYLEETSVREVAGLLGLEPKTVESRLYQARQALRRLVGAEPGRAPGGTERGR